MDLFLSMFIASLFRVRDIDSSTLFGWKGYISSFSSSSVLCPEEALAVPQGGRWLFVSRDMLVAFVDFIIWNRRKRAARKSAAPAASKPLSPISIFGR
jgi:hypothetical protein